MKQVSTISIRPTQFALGMKEVEFKINHLSKLKNHEIQSYLKDHPLPAIKYKDENHVIDHHHLARAVWELDIEGIWVDERDDLTHLSRTKFWDTMRDKKWIHLFDQFGEGPRNPELLPASIRYLADDPYRSIAWAVRDSGGYEKTTKPFSEFLWANFFRKKLDIFLVLNDFDEAGKQAIKLAHSDVAKHLPGWSPTRLKIEKPVIDTK